MKSQCGNWLDEKLEELVGSEVYAGEKTNEEIAEQYGLKTSDIVKLNYNENLYIPREKVAALLKQVADEVDFRIYPQNEESKLKEAIAEYLQVTPENVSLGNSSDEVMERSIRFFVDKNSSALTFAPTFSVFKYSVTFQGSKYIEVNLKDDFSVDMDAMRKAFTPDTKLLYLCSPNNPTASALKPREMEALIEEFPGIVMVDEAYAEYADYSVVPLIKKYENLVVLRTFSKAFSLAGLRLGYAIANPRLAKGLNRAPAPYVVNVISLRMGVKMLENLELVRESVSALKKERGKLIEALNSINGVHSFDSKTNFVTFTTQKPHSEVYERALRQGFVIKNLGRLLNYENCLRTTVGLPEMNAKLLKALHDYMSETT